MTSRDNITDCVIGASYADESSEDNQNDTPNKILTSSQQSSVLPLGSPAEVNGEFVDDCMSQLQSDSSANIAATSENVVAELDAEYLEKYELVCGSDRPSSHQS